MAADALEDDDSSSAAELDDLEALLAEREADVELLLDAETDALDAEWALRAAAEAERDWELEAEDFEEERAEWALSTAILAAREAE